MLSALALAFSKGQIIFAIVFLVGFIGVLIWSYTKDKHLTKNHYKGVAIWILVSIILFMITYRYLVKVLH